MRFLTTLLALLFLLTSVQAAPEVSPTDSATYRPERGMLTRFGEVTDQVEAKASELVGNALGLLGVPYKRGGSNASTGFDCSGFVRSIYQQTAGLLLPRSADQQAAVTEKIDRQDLQPGDLVFFNTMRRAFSHVGIYIGDGKFVHSPKPGAKVRVEDMGIAYWARRFDGARRVPVESAQPANATP
jgi:cell wall-associated NlpC family hydrolase